MNAGRNDIDDIHAFYTALVKRNASLIKWLCLRQADGDQALCDDLVQEVLLALWLHLGSYRRHLPEKAWVGWTARTILYNYRRQRLPPPERLAFEVADSLAEEALHTRETLDELTAYLSDDERDLLRRHLEGYNTKEIADQTGLSPNAVYKRIQKAMQKLRDINKKINSK